MDFKTWLWEQLYADGYIEEEDCATEDLTEELITSFTQLTSADIENYKKDYTKYCNSNGFTPNYNLL